MCRRGIGLVLLCLALPLSSLAQVSERSRAEIIRKVYAEESAARIDMPFGGEGVLLSELGQINQEKLSKQIQKNGKSVQSGRIVQVTDIEFGSKTIDIELDGGGKAKKRLGGHVQVSVGGGAPPPSRPSNAPKIRGSKITLTFMNKVPVDLTSDQLIKLLAPVLDFTKHTVTATSIETVPPEFKEAVLAKQAVIGMDQDTVLLSMGRPDLRTAEKVNGIEQEEWQYNGRGIRKTFVTFENSIVVRVTEY